MDSLVPKIQFKKLFFDTKKLTKALSAGVEQALRWAGGYVRRTARNSIKKPGKRITEAANAFGRSPVSGPGKPPFSQTGALKDNIFFGYDPRAEKVVVGPTKLNQVFFGEDGRPAYGTVPGILERGGTIGIMEWFKYGEWSRIDLRRSRREISKYKTRLRKVTIAPRPYMGPALAKSLDKIPPKFRNIL